MKPPAAWPGGRWGLSLLWLGLGLAGLGLADPRRLVGGEPSWAQICSAALARPLFASAAGVGARPQTRLHILSCQPLPELPGMSITSALVDFPPLAYTPAHRHPGSVSAVVLEGRLRSQMAGSAAQDYDIGQSWFEPPRALHLFAENPDPQRPARLLATFISEQACKNLVIPEPPAPP